MPVATCLALSAQPTAKLARTEETEIWSDVEILQILQTHQYGKRLNTLNKDRIYKRARSYRWIGDNLFRLRAGEQWWWRQGQGSGFIWH